ncbi:MAG: mechanosensitive ion channel family protein, partial [Solirubrobacterales bacterium]|nr:mechanosensitive ion channel family protein [Solirubrobacterales bacterium]
MALPSYLPLLADASPARLRSVCGDDPGFWCRELLNGTGNRTAAGLGDALIGTPLKLLAILLVAFIVNRLARRGVRSVLAKLQPGAVAVPARLGRLTHRRDGQARR